MAVPVLRLARFCPRCRPKACTYCCCRVETVLLRPPLRRAAELAAGDELRFGGGLVRVAAAENHGARGIWLELSNGIRGHVPPGVRFRTAGPL